VKFSKWLIFQTAVQQNMKLSYLRGNARCCILIDNLDTSVIGFTTIDDSP